MPIVTRPLTPGDRADVLRIADALPEWFDEDARTRAIPADLLHQQGFVAVRDGRVVGFILLYAAEGRLNIGWMGVQPERRRAGVGAALLSAAEAQARTCGLDEIATWTLGPGVDYPPYASTRAFYLKQGFSVYQTSRTDNPGCPEEIRLKKSLI